jgi:hypothetical protein
MQFVNEYTTSIKYDPNDPIFPVCKFCEWKLLVAVNSCGELRESIARLSD